jgi:hypothetical protein
MDNITSARERLKICNSANKFCQNSVNVDNLLNKNKNATTNHFWNAIKEWINVNDYKNPLAIQSELALPIVKIIDSNTLLAWKAELNALGYIVIVDSSAFKVKLP